jgi:GNAT superfamily N-acetyltransferase
MASDTDGTSPRLSTVVTYLEMTQQPTSPTPTRPALPIALMRAVDMPVSFYRYLYDTIGEDWLWYERRLLDDAALAEIIHHPDVEIYVLYVNGAPGGYGELNRRGGGTEVDLAYFGLLAECIGRGLGGYFLRWLVDQAWSYEPSRLTVNTCDLDHPRALRTYQSLGFAPNQRETLEFDDPRDRGMFTEWRDHRI